MRLLLAAALALCALCGPLSKVRALENGLARTPPMGWLAWTRFTCQLDCQRHPDSCINAALFERAAERLAADGWLQRGYQLLHIDDCWSERQRDPNTKRLLPDAARFPAGIGALAERAHQLGLKLGIYGDCGHSTCAGFPGQLGNESEPGAPADYFQLDAHTLAEWRLDALKFDGCHVEPRRAEAVCPGMATALAAAGRPVLLTCEWPFYLMYAHAEPDFELAASSCNAWRYYDDIDDSWLSVLNTIDYTARHQRTILKHHGPGHWFDPDQLVIGNFGLSVAQARAQMAIWSVWAAPLFMSNDLGAIRPEFKRILQNEHLIALDQDALGVFGQLVASADGGQVQAFVKPVLPVRDGCPSFGLVVLSRKTLGNRQKVSFPLAELLLGAPVGQAALNQERVREFEARTNSSAPVRQQDDTIEPAECLERLRLAVEQPDEAPMQFAVEDLMDSLDAPERIGAHESLRLLVSPSDVRAIKLVELEQD